MSDIVVVNKTSKIKNRINTASLEKLMTFFHEVDNLFVPPLRTHVNSIDEYAIKLKDNADVFEAWSGDELIGIAAVYLNNNATKVGFITSVVVLKEYQKLGIARVLIRIAIEYAKKKGFKRLELEVNKDNERAYNLYSEFGFTVEVTDNGRMRLEF